MKTSPFQHEVLLHWGPVGVTRPVVTTWAIIAILALAARIATRRLSIERPGRVQMLAELLLTTIRDEMRSTMRLDPAPFLPLVATLFLFILAANLSGLLPGVEPPTGAVETDLALALTVFVAVLRWGMQRRGVAGYLRTFVQPNPLLLPLNVLEALTRVVSMTVRLFGNVMSGMFISAVVLSLAGLLVPIPFMALDLLTGVIQAYIFTVLSMVFIAAAASDGDG